MIPDNIRFLAWSEGIEGDSIAIEYYGDILIISPQGIYKKNHLAGPRVIGPSAFRSRFLIREDWNKDIEGQRLHFFGPSLFVFLFNCGKRLFNFFSFKKVYKRIKK